jgi:hypothetical protein
MNNITYNINDQIYNEQSDTLSDSDESNAYDMSCIDPESELQIKKCKYSNIDDEEYQRNNSVAKTIDYDLNYSVKYLGCILEFYEIRKTKLNKKEIIKKIVEYEIDKNNKETVERRYRLFTNFIELKNDKYFGRHVMGGL